MSLIPDYHIYVRRKMDLLESIGYKITNVKFKYLLSVLYYLGLQKLISKRNTN